MCGIVGIVGEHKNLISILCETLIHRGPNDSGNFIEDNISFGHLRLSIIDISNAGHQPMYYSPSMGASSAKFFSEDMSRSDYVITYNGEIYNFMELKTELLKYNYVFRTNSDTELLLAAYIHWGEQCVEHFNGMWAFAIYDKPKNILFLSRDRLGIKPLYYFCDKTNFIFASEMKPFFKCNIDLQISNNSLAHFFILNYTPSQSSMLKNINKIEAATNLIYDLAKLQISKYYKYWKINVCPSPMKFSEAETQVYSLIEDSVKKRMLADVSVGAFLSGGLDSSVIVYFMSQQVSRLKTFSIKFDHTQYNESQWAKIIANQFGTEHHEIDFNYNDVKNLIDILPTYYDEPFGDSSMIATFLCSKVASQHVSVVLSGTGSDEIFGGYRRYKEYILLQKLFLLPTAVKNFICSIYRYENVDKAKKLKDLLNSNNLYTLYIKLLSDMFRGEETMLASTEDINYVHNFFASRTDISGVLSFDQNSYLTDDLLVKEDRATMAHSIEGRVPFIDYRLVELANLLPTRYKINLGAGKYILKHLFKNKLPSSIVYRPKMGFAVPLKHYFCQQLKDYAKEIIFDFSDFKYYDKDNLLKMWNLHQTKQSDYSAIFWNIIMFNKWYEKFLKKD